MRLRHSNQSTHSAHRARVTALGALTTYAPSRYAQPHLHAPRLRFSTLFSARGRWDKQCEITRELYSSHGKHNTHGHGTHAHEQMTNADRMHLLTSSKTSTQDCTSQPMCSCHLPHNECEQHHQAHDDGPVDPKRASALDPWREIRDLLLLRAREWGRSGRRRHMHERRGRACLVSSSGRVWRVSGRDARSRWRVR